MRILVIEDEPKVASFIQRALQEESYAVDLCADGSTGLDFAKDIPYDLIVLDLMLPALSGLDLLRALRKEKVTTPVIILTARSQVDDRVAGLDAGADDYLTKPFSIEELLARVRARLRQTTHTMDVIQVDDLVLNPSTRVVVRGTRRIELTAKAYALLE